MSNQARWCRTCGQRLLYANGTEQQWDALAKRLEALLPDGCEVRVAEATNWYEPGTWRHGLYYRFLVLLVREVGIEHDLAAMDLDLLGGCDDADEKGPYYIYDVDPGRTVAWMQRRLKKAEATGSGSRSVETAGTATAPPRP